jgi:FkbM family methyltransferase
MQFADCSPAYVDLRDGQAHGLLQDHPWQRTPSEVAEQEIMCHVVSQGDVACDVGANLGLHSVLLAKLIGPTGHLHVFEPNPALLQILAVTVAGIENATLHPYALSNRAGRTIFFVPTDHQKTSLANWLEEFGKGGKPIDCEQRRLDDLIRDDVIPQPDFIKCDVGGAELLVFQGASATFDRLDAPIILFEANAYTVRGFRPTLMDAANFLQTLALPRYHLFEVLAAGGCRPFDTPTLHHFNALAVPDSKIGGFPELGGLPT